MLHAYVCVCVRACVSYVRDDFILRANRWKYFSLVLIKSFFLKKNYKTGGERWKFRDFCVIWMNVGIGIQCITCCQPLIIISLIDYLYYTPRFGYSAVLRLFSGWMLVIVRTYAYVLRRPWASNMAWFFTRKSKYFGGTVSSCWCPRISRKHPIVIYTRTRTYSAWYWYVQYTCG